MYYDILQWNAMVRQALNAALHVGHSDEWLSL